MNFKVFYEILWWENNIFLNRDIFLATLFSNELPIVKQRKGFQINVLGTLVFLNSP